MNREWTAKWIGTEPGDSIHPVIFKDFYIDDPIKKATLFIAGFGVFEAYINGVRVGEEYLTPSAFDPEKGIPYYEFDVTQMLNCGPDSDANSIDVFLGEGWRTEEDRFGLKAELEIEVVKEVAVPMDSLLNEENTESLFDEGFSPETGLTPDYEEELEALLESEVLSEPGDEAEPDKMVFLAMEGEVKTKEVKKPLYLDDVSDLDGFLERVIDEEAKKKRKPAAPQKVVPARRRSAHFFTMETKPEVKAPEPEKEQAAPAEEVMPEAADDGDDFDLDIFEFEDWDELNLGAEEASEGTEEEDTAEIEDSAEAEQAEETEAAAEEVIEETYEEASEVTEEEAAKETEAAAEEVIEETYEEASEVADEEAAEEPAAFEEEEQAEEAEAAAEEVIEETYEEASEETEVEAVKEPAAFEEEEQAEEAEAAAEEVIEETYEEVSEATEEPIVPEEDEAKTEIGEPDEFSGLLSSDLNVEPYGITDDELEALFDDISIETDEAAAETGEAEETVAEAEEITEPEDIAEESDVEAEVETEEDEDEEGAAETEAAAETDAEEEASVEESDEGIDELTEAETESGEAEETDSEVDEIAEPGDIAEESEGETEAEESDEGIDELTEAEEAADEAAELSGEETAEENDIEEAESSPELTEEETADLAAFEEELESELFADDSLFGEEPEMIKVEEAEDAAAEEEIEPEDIAAEEPEVLEEKVAEDKGTEAELADSAEEELDLLETEGEAKAEDEMTEPEAEVTEAEESVEESDEVTEELAEIEEPAAEAAEPEEEASPELTEKELTETAEPVGEAAGPEGITADIGVPEGIAAAALAVPGGLAAAAIAGLAGGIEPETEAKVSPELTEEELADLDAFGDELEEIEALDEENAAEPETEAEEEAADFVPAAAAPAVRTEQITETILIGTDETWSYYASDIECSGRREVFDRLRWEEGENPEKAVWELDYDLPVVPRRNLPVIIKERLKVKEIRPADDGSFVLDFGQVFDGFVTFRSELSRGTKVELKYASTPEAENPEEGGSFLYISDGVPEEVTPHFTCFEGRYVTVSGWEGEPAPEDFAACVLYSDIKRTGYLETSSDVLNALFDDVLSEQKRSSIAVPDDCTQRTVYSFAPAASYNMDTKEFLCAYLKELQEKEDSAPSADEAFIIWNLYMMYGDEAILRDHYDLMKRWTDHVDARDAERTEKHYLYDFESDRRDLPVIDEKTDPVFQASAYYFEAARLISEAAKELGNEKDAFRYVRLARRIKQAILEEFYTSTGRFALDTQTACITALRFGLYVDKKKVTDALALRLKKDRYEISCAPAETSFLCHTLAENGMEELAYDLLLNEKIEKGANAAEFLYTDVAGIRPVEPGFAKIRLAPVPDGRLQYCFSTYKLPEGDIISVWNINEQGALSFHFEIPQGITATIALPYYPVCAAGGNEVTVRGGSYDYTYMPSKKMLKED